jgi:hypothetical protein
LILKFFPFGEIIKYKCSIIFTSLNKEEQFPNLVLLYLNDFNGWEPNERKIKF